MALTTKKIHQFNTVIPLWDEHSSADPISRDSQGNTVITFMASGDRNEFVEVKMNSGDAVHLTCWLIAKYGDTLPARKAIKKVNYRDPTEIACP